MGIFRFVRWIAEGEPIQIFGDGEQSRDFTFVDDIADGTIAALKPLGYEIINLGGGQQTRDIELDHPAAGDSIRAQTNRSIPQAPRCRHDVNVG